MLLEKNHIDYLLNLLFESRCTLCQSSSTNVICKNCQKKFKERNYPLKYMRNISVYSWGMYDGSLRDAILKLKNGDSDIGLILGNLLSEFINYNIKPCTKKTLMINTPSHKSRVKSRGYCQTEIIARQICKNLNLHFSNSKLTRIKETKFMNEMRNIDDRERNIKNAFKITESIEHKRIIIIDDILTSGHTLMEIAKTIKEKYPEKELIGITVASGDKY